MGSSGFSSSLLVILNIVNVVFGLALSAASIWFFIELQTLTSLRNQNHYILDYKLNWPQAIPWLFLFSGIFVLLVSCCGFVGTRKRSRGVLFTYVVFQGFALVLLVIAASMTLIFADSWHSDQFIADTILDAYTNTMSDQRVEAAFGSIERKFRCCGASGPRDYKRWRSSFPASCCDTYSPRTGEYVDCDMTSKLPNERLGCVYVAGHYVRIAVKVFAAGAVVTALVGLLTLVVALMLARRLKRRKTEEVTVQHEFESKKDVL